MIFRINEHGKIFVSNGLAAQATSGRVTDVMVNGDNDNLMISLPDFDHFKPTLTNGTELPQTSNLYINMRCKEKVYFEDGALYDVNKSQISDSDVFTFIMGVVYKSTTPNPGYEGYYIVWNLYKNGQFLRSSSLQTPTEEYEMIANLLIVDSTNLASMTTDTNKTPGFNLVCYGTDEVRIARGDPSSGSIQWGTWPATQNKPQCSDNCHHFIQVLPDYELNDNYENKIDINHNMSEIASIHDDIDDINDELIAVGASVEESRSLYVSR